MENPRVIETLNKAIALEHAATIQYKQHALLVRGLWRKVFADDFFAASRSSQEHAYRFGQKVVALGGVPRCPFHKFAASPAAARLYGLGGYKVRANRWVREL